MALDHNSDIFQIHTNLPISEETLLSSADNNAQTLENAATEGLKSFASPLAASALTARMLERIMRHLRQAEYDLADPEGESFWLRHQKLDNEMTRFLLTMPDHLRPATTQHPLAFFVNMCLHEFTISLFTAASIAAQKSALKTEMLSSLRLRARRAAEETINTMKAQSFMGIRKVTLNPAVSPI